MNRILFPFESCRILWNTQDLTIFGISFGPMHIVTYSITALIATLVVSLLAYYLWKIKGLAKKDFLYIHLITIFGIFCGARLSHMLFYQNFAFIEFFIELFNPHRSGFSSVGGFISGFLFALLACKWRKINIWKYTDCFTLGFGLAFAIGRIGCYCNPCCYGKHTIMPWGIDFFGDGPRHPTQIYDIINSLFIFTIAWINKEKEKFLNIKTFDGFLTLLCLMIYSTIRFIIQFSRDDPELFLNIQFSHLAFLGMFIFAAIIFYRNSKSS